jgi:hypothetical protein
VTTTWGTNLVLTNVYTGEAWFGAGPSAGTVDAGPDPPDGLVVEFMEAGVRKSEVVRAEVAAPQEYSWLVRMRSVGTAPTDATIKVGVWEDATHLFVPQDFSVVLDNSAAGIFVNLRKENGYITGLPKSATLYVDNAVNIQSIENLDPLVGTYGDPVRLRVTVRNTGRYTDTYNVGAGGTLDSITLAPDTEGSVIVTTTLPLGTNVPIVITAEGDYARDQDFVLATGVQPIVLKGYDSAYSLNRAGILPWVPYDNDPTTPTPGSPPAMVAKKVGSGSVIAAGIAATCRGAPGITMRWVLGELNVLMENMFKWMTSGTNVLWFEDNRVYYMNQERGCRYLTDNLRARGYTIDGLADNTVTVPITDTLLSGYDIFVLPQLQIGDRYLGGDPDLLSDAEVQAIKSFVQNGGGLLITESADYGGYNYARVGNKILHELGFGWWFQHDQLTDNIYKVTYDYQPVVLAEDTNDIGSAYRAATGKENIRLYNACTLIPEPTLSATVAAPDSEGTEESSIVVPITIANLSVGAVWDNYFLWVEDTKGWTDNDNLSARNIKVDNGASATVDLTVVIPMGTGGQKDTITVYARSFSGYGSSPLIFRGIFIVTSVSKGLKIDNTFGNMAHVTLVDTLVDPCWTYDPLTFTVILTNNKVLDDKYVLKAEWIDIAYENDNTAGLKLTPDELFVPAKDTEYAALSVTLPNSWVGGQSGTIRIWAQGVLAENQQKKILENLYAYVTVYAETKRSVQIEIQPNNLEPQTGAPGSPLVWLVVVKNTGNARNVYTTQVIDSAANVSRDSLPRKDGDPWGAELENKSNVILEPGKKWFTYLKVNVPSNAYTSENCTITVKVSGTDAYDEYTVFAHVLEPGPRIPEGVIEIAVATQVIAIYVHPTTYDFGVMDEHKVKLTDNNWFKLRNTGNVEENIFVRGTNAQSMPGEPVTTWKLDNQATGLDRYMMWILQGTEPPFVLSTELSEKPIWSYLAPGEERYFGLKIQTPTAITTPARMWARVKFVAVSAGTENVGSSP